MPVPASSAAYDGIICLTRVFDSSGRMIFEMDCDQDQRLLHCKWFGHIEEEEPAIKACEEIVDAIAKWQLHRVLNDNTQQFGPWPNLDNWISAKWNQRLYDVGLRRLAQLSAGSISTGISTRQAFSWQTAPFQVAYFEQETLARRWLLD